MIEDLGIAVVAGGSSSRFGGRDKLFLEIDELHEDDLIKGYNVIW